jgi:hypothetical protein
MAYRAPRFAHVHAARDVGVAGISLSEGTEHSGFPIANLIDDRASTLFMWSALVTSPSIDVDLDPTASGTWKTGLNRFIIPANHNIQNLRVYEDSAPTFDTDGGNPERQLRSLLNTTPGVQIDKPFDLFTQSLRYLRIKFFTNAQFYLSQLIYTETVTLDYGPTLAESIDEYRDNVSRLLQKTGISLTVQNGPQQRYLEYTYESGLQETDLTKIEALVANAGMSKPFWVDPASFSTPPEDDEPALWMKFEEMPQAEYFVGVPMRDARRKVFRIRLIESVD